MPTPPHGVARRTQPSRTLISHADWLRRTAVRIGMRSKELQDIDRLLLDYGRISTSWRQGQEWKGKFLREKFDAYTLKNPKWQTSDRNANRAMSELDEQMDRCGYTQAERDPAGALAMRYYTLRFLAHVEVDAPLNLAEIINSLIDGSSDLNDAAKTIVAEGRGLAAAAGGGADASKGLLSTLVSSLGDLLKELCAKMGEFGVMLLRAISTRLADIVLKVFGAALAQLGAVIDLGKNLAAAVKAAAQVYHSRHLVAATIPGQPRTIVKAVRDQVIGEGKDAMYGAIWTAINIGLNATMPIAGCIMKALVSVYKFIADIVSKNRAIKAIRDVIAGAKVKYDNKAIENGREFRNWFTQVVSQSPLIASYLMCNPYTGSFYGFLAMVASDGSELGFETLQRNLGEFDDTKQAAHRFILASSFQLKSDEKDVGHALRLAVGPPVPESAVAAGIWSRIKGTAIGAAEAMA